MAWTFLDPVSGIYRVAANLSIIHIPNYRPQLAGKKGRAAERGKKTRFESSALPPEASPNSAACCINVRVRRVAEVLRERSILVPEATSAFIPGLPQEARCSARGCFVFHAADCRASWEANSEILTGLCALVTMVTKPEVWERSSTRVVRRYRWLITTEITRNEKNKSGFPISRVLCCCPNQPGGGAGSSWTSRNAVFTGFYIFTRVTLYSIIYIRCTRETKLYPTHALRAWDRLCWS